LSGLLKCGQCGGNLVPHKANDNNFFSYKDEAGIKHQGASVCYYHCKSYKKSPIPDFKKCSGVSILERYPENVRRPNPYNQGLPLLEAIYPLLFRAYIEHVAHEKLLTPALLKEKEECIERLEQIQILENTYTRKFEDGVLDSTQYDAIMVEKKEKRLSTEKRIKEIEQELELSSLKDLPISLDVLTYPQKMPMYLYRALAFRVFKSIILYPDGIRLVMNSKHYKPGEKHFFTLEKLRIKRAFRLPWWYAGIDTKTITPKSRLTVVYLNKSTMAGIYKPFSVVHNDPLLQVINLGNNEPISRRNANQKDGDKSLSDILTKLFGKQPAQQRTTLSSSLFHDQGNIKNAIFDA